MRKIILLSMLFVLLFCVPVEASTFTFGNSIVTSKLTANYNCNHSDTEAIGLLFVYMGVTYDCPDHGEWVKIAGSGWSSCSTCKVCGEHVYAPPYSDQRLLDVIHSIAAGQAACPYCGWISYPTGMSQNEAYYEDVGPDNKIFNSPLPLSVQQSLRSEGIY